MRKSWAPAPSKSGWLIGIYAFCQLFSGPLLGRMSDHTGRKPLLMVSQAGTFVGFLITAFAPSLWILFVARAIDGCTAGNLSLAQAYISDVTEPKDRAKSFGIIGIAFGLGFLIGPAISGLLARYDYRYPIFAAALHVGHQHPDDVSAVAGCDSRPGPGRARPDPEASGSLWSSGAPMPSIFDSRRWRQSSGSFSALHSDSRCLSRACRWCSNAG